jgi:hypothetical protein
MHVVKTAIVAAFAGALTLSAAAAGEPHGFNLSAPGVEIHVNPDGSNGGYTGHFRFGDGPDAFVGQAHFDTRNHSDQTHPDTAPPKSAAPSNPPPSADQPVTPKCPDGQELRDGWCHPQQQ